MCGRYAWHLRPSEARQRLEEDLNMPVDEAPDDDGPNSPKSSYNFCPGYHGLIYRAATNDRGTDATPLEDGNEETTAVQTANDNDEADSQPSRKKAKLSHPTSPPVDGLATRETKYKLQSAKWGLIPFWTKRPPDYGSMLRTINCRDDSLAQSGGMWTTMKQRKRCIVLCEGFYEWLKKNNGKDRVPHFVKRKDGGLMCMAGLWDCVQYETEENGEGEDGKGEGEKLYTYTIITTDSNKQLSFLHDRMPVILEPGSEDMKTWLDPHNPGWTKELQAMLKPFQGELECYQVDKAVGKVGNNSPNFIIPIDSKDNKKNIMNFFSGAQKASPSKPAAIKQDPDETRETSKLEDPESNAPLPVPSQKIKQELDSPILTSTPRKRSHSDLSDVDLFDAEKSPPTYTYNPPTKPRTAAVTRSTAASKSTTARENTDAEEAGQNSTVEEDAKPPPSTPTKKRSATKNESTMKKTPAKGPEKGERKITAFFGGK